MSYPMLPETIQEAMADFDASLAQKGPLHWRYVDACAMVGEWVSDLRKATADAYVAQFRFEQFNDEAVEASMFMTPGQARPLLEEFVMVAEHTEGLLWSYAQVCELTDRRWKTIEALDFTAELERRRRAMGLSPAGLLELDQADGRTIADILADRLRNEMDVQMRGWVTDLYEALLERGRLYDQVNEAMTQLQGLVGALRADVD